MNTSAKNAQHERPAFGRASRQPRGCTRRQSRGAALVELMIASLILSIGLMGMMSIWNYAFSVTATTDDQGIAYNLARQQMEQVKKLGFAYPEGTVTLYYDGNQTAQASAASARYSVVTSVVSAAVTSGVAGQAGAVPDANNVRTVTITVQLIANAQTLYSTNTYLARAGI